MTFFQFTAPQPGQKYDYPTLGFFAADGAILDGTASNPAITTAPDAHWTVVASGPESGITRYRQPQTPPDDQSSWDGSLLVYDATTRAFVRKLPSQALAPGSPLDAAVAPLVPSTSGSATAAALSTAYARGISVKSYGAKGDGTTDDTTAIQNALNAVSSDGGYVWFPAGTYITSAALVPKPNTTLIGEGAASCLKSNHTGMGISLVHAANANVGDYLTIHNLKLWNTNASNTGAGFESVSGQHYEFRNVTIIGFQWGMILDGAEVALFDNMYIAGQLANGGCVWITNGPDRTAGMVTNSANRLTFDACAFNAETNGGYGVVDDGGWNHQYVGCSFNFGSVQLRAASTSALVVMGGEMENGGTRSILFATNTLLGNSYGANNAAAIRSAVISTGSLTAPFGIEVQASGLQSGLFESVSFYTKNTAVKGTSNIATLISIGNEQNSTVSPPLYDGTATNTHVAFDRTGAGITVPSLASKLPISFAGVQLQLSHPSYKTIQHESRFDASKTYHIFNFTDGIEYLQWDQPGNATLPKTVKATTGFKDGSQSPAFAASMSLNLGLGSLYYLNLTGNITSLGFSNPVADTMYEIHFVQDATGSRTLAGASSAFKWAGGVAPTLSTGPGKRDIIRFRSDGTNLYEIGRTVNVG